MLTVLIVLILVAAAFFSYKFITVNEVNVQGLKRQNKETVEKILFEDNTERSFLRLLYEKVTGKNKHIPFVEEYDIEIVSLNSINVTVYEKSITGYVVCMEKNWYFDKDGIVVECTGDFLEGIPRISGLAFDYVVVDDKLPLEDEDIFGKLLDLTQMISKYKMNVTQINMYKGEITIYIGNVRVKLGDGRDMNDKMIDLNDMMPTMEDIPGVLDMTEYDASRKGYIFKKDSEE